uniref:Myotubularin phosphatase domain-containing protein n=2 Tax=Macrostomum lignano TaxID=282301 RepID=A0A1I8GI01_9PLAT
LSINAIPSVNPLSAIMFGPVNYADAPPELCYSNCPRIYPAAEDSSAPSSTASENSTRRPSASALSDIFLTETGRALYPVRKRPCYLLIRFTKPHCRVLRNFIISCSTRLAVVNGDYCGIATKVFNVKTDAPDPVQSVGLLRFASTEQAYRFVTDERHFSNKEFLGGRFDVWCLSLHSPDRSVMPSPIEPRKLISNMCVFHLVHVRVHAAKPEGMDMTAEALQLAEAEISELQTRLEASLAAVDRYEGRLVVRASAGESGSATRIRGQPFLNPLGEPGKSVYVSQWPGVRQFWQWMDGPDGQEFGRCIGELAGVGFESLLFTACLDFRDVV